MLTYDGKEIVKSTTFGISYENRGILYGETVFTTMRSFDGKYLFIKDHFERLRKGINYLYPDIKEDWKEFEKKLRIGLNLLKEQIVDENSDGFFRITIYPHTINGPNLTENVEELKFYILSKKIKKGFEKNNFVKAKLASVNLPRNSLPGFVKSGTYLETARELRMARLESFDDVIFLNEEGFLTEGSTSNLFFRLDDTIMTPALDTGILEGITRRHILAFLRNNQVDIVEGKYLEEKLLLAQEAWLVSSIKGIRPLAYFGKNHKFDCEKGHWTDKLIEQFASYCKKYE